MEAEPPVDRRAWRLLPSEQVLWSGRPRPHVPLDAHWRVGSALLGLLALVSFLFALLLRIGGLSGVRGALLVSGYFTLLAIGAAWGPRWWREKLRFVATDRRVSWRWGRLRRQIQLETMSYARIHWHATVPEVGHLELVCAVPFGPLARRQRLLLPDVQRPDAVLARLQGLRPAPHGADLDLPLVERISPEERLSWAGGPSGSVLGWRELLTGGLGLLVLSGALAYGHRIGALLAQLEEHGLLVRSWAWSLLFVAGAVTWSVMTAVGGGLLWYGWWRSRRLGTCTEYVVTDRRVLVRRGRVELALNRNRIVDVASIRSRSGAEHLFLVLDGPGSRALATSGALDSHLPARGAVPPVFFGVRDGARARAALLEGNEGEMAGRQRSMERGS